MVLPPSGAAADAGPSPLRCSHCIEPGQSADAPSPAPDASPSQGLATVVAEMSLSGAARAPQAPRAAPPQYQRQQQSAAATGPRGAPSYYAAIDCATCGLPLGGTGIVVRGRVVHDSLACSVGTPRPRVEDEGALLRARAARMGAVSLASQAAGAPTWAAVSLASQAAGAPSRSQVDATSNPLAAAIEQRRGAGAWLATAHGAWMVMPMARRQAQQPTCTHLHSLGQTDQMVDSASRRCSCRGMWQAVRWRDPS